MKCKSCVIGQRIILKKNGNNIPVGTKGIILEDSSIPRVKLFLDEWSDDMYFTDRVSNVDGVEYEYVTILDHLEIKKDKDVPYLQDVTVFALRV